MATGQTEPDVESQLAVLEKQKKEIEGLVKTLEEANAFPSIALDIHRLCHRTDWNSSAVSLHAVSSVAIETAAAAAQSEEGRRERRGCEVVTGKEMASEARPCAVSLTS